ncbi:hypothetical protein P7K49_017295 [Saguinus oedipus]|uniref:Uncharacterized protein n=1 Tax=Saguinus oedipus TaxID=9490 RepID=A0ABQ9V242_SAGOE|nr:hypothetical protein P7K49_017295 [Saguinus oedipus]
MDFPLNLKLSVQIPAAAPPRDSPRKCCLDVPVRLHASPPTQRPAPTTTLIPSHRRSAYRTLDAADPLGADDGDRATDATDAVSAWDAADTLSALRPPPTSLPRHLQSRRADCSPDSIRAWDAAASSSRRRGANRPADIPQHAADAHYADPVAYAPDALTVPRMPHHRAADPADAASAWNPDAEPMTAPRMSPTSLPRRRRHLPCERLESRQTADRAVDAPNQLTAPPTFPRRRPCCDAIRAWAASDTT